MVTAVKAAGKAVAHAARTATKAVAHAAVATAHYAAKHSKVIAEAGLAAIDTTSNHLFWIPGTGAHGGLWAKAGSLKYGTHLRTPSGGYAAVVGGWTPMTTTGWMWDLTIPGDNDHDFYIDTATTDVLVHNAGGPGPCQAGRAGEVAAGIVKNTRAISINGTSRIPDELNATTIGEVKNVAYQWLSSQLGDDLDYAQQTGRVFNLYVRASTRFSRPLQALVNSGAVNRIDVLP